MVSKSKLTKIRIPDCRSMAYRFIRITRSRIFWSGRVSDRILRNHFLCTGDGRVFPGRQQLYSSQSFTYSRSYCTGMVFHTVLFDAACSYGKFPGVDAKLWGVILMAASVVIFCFLPWLDRSPVKSIRYKGPYFKFALTLFVISFCSWMAGY